MTVKMAEVFPFDGMDRRWNPSAALPFCVRLSPEERRKEVPIKIWEIFKFTVDNRGEIGYTNPCPV